MWGSPLENNGSQQWSQMAANMTKERTTRHMPPDGSIWHYLWCILAKKIEL